MVRPVLLRVANLEAGGVERGPAPTGRLADRGCWDRRERFGEYDSTHTDQQCVFGAERRFD